MPTDVKVPALKTPAGRAAAIPVRESLKLQHVEAEAVKVTPGHRVAGRHARRKHLDALSGHKDPGISVGCSRACRPSR